jgi:sortase A
MRNVLVWVGRVLITTGILVLLFVAYQLWGTSLYTARAQDNLRADFHQALRHQSTTTAPSTAGGLGVAPSTSTSTSAVDERVPKGDATAEIDIPKLGWSEPYVVVEGVDVDDLRKGPGHYPATPLPGEEGNAAIAGHRTTYGAPFGDLDQLRSGDEITVRTLRGTFEYRVDASSPFVVSPSDVSVLLPAPDPARPGHNLATLTLTTCNPKYSAAERLIVKARLVLPQGATALPPSSDTSGDLHVTVGGLSGDSGSLVPAILWGLVVALVGGAWWFVFHRRPRWYVGIAGVIPFLVVLFVFYVYVERALPSNY